jgi:hypothetical protein
MGKYLDGCAGIASQLSIREVEDCVVGREIGQGSKFTSYSLGIIAVAGHEIYACLKIPNKSIVDRAFEIAARYAKEVVAIDDLLIRDESLVPYVPLFMAPLAIEGAGLVGILTEDATKNGKLEIREGAGFALEKRVIEAYSDVHGTSDAVFLDEVVRNSLMFTLGNFADGFQERLLDFTPPPIIGIGNISGIRRQVESGEHVVTIPSGCTLTQSVETM